MLAKAVWPNRQKEVILKVLTIANHFEHLAGLRRKHGWENDTVSTDWSPQCSSFKCVYSKFWQNDFLVQQPLPSSAFLKLLNLKPWTQHKLNHTSYLFPQFGSTLSDNWKMILVYLFWWRDSLYQTGWLVDDYWWKSGWLGVHNSKSNSKQIMARELRHHECWFLNNHAIRTCMSWQNSNALVSTINHLYASNDVIRVMG
jgi:hypothetical protein